VALAALLLNGSISGTPFSMGWNFSAPNYRLRGGHGFWRVGRGRIALVTSLLLFTSLLVANPHFLLHAHISPSEAEHSAKSRILEAFQADPGRLLTGMIYYFQ